MGKKKRNISKQQKKKPTDSETAKKDGESTDHGHYDGVSLANTKNGETQRKKDQDQDQDQNQDHLDPSDLKESELLPKLEEEMRTTKLNMANFEKEQQASSEEQGNVEKKEIEALEDELVSMASKFEISTKRTVQRLSEMNKYKDSGSVTTEELETIREAGKQLIEQQQKPKGLLAQLMRDLVLPADKKGNPRRRRKNLNISSQELKKLKEQIEMNLTTIESVEKSLDDYEEKFRKYNLPKLKDRSSESLDRYLEKLREFMRSTWKEAAVKCRHKEHRSFIEWMLKLAQSNDSGQRATFKALKVVFDDIGIQISRFLIEYFLLISVSAEREEIVASLFEVKSIIRCLIIEENSVVINNFISVVEFFDQTMRMSKPSSDEKAKGKGKKIHVVKKSDLQIEKENDALHLIIMEILRLEVAFSHPDLPMMLTNEVFLAMGKHLTDNVFEDKLNRISAKIDGIKSEFFSVQHKDSKRNFFEQMLDLGIKEIWNENELDLKSRAS